MMFDDEHIECIHHYMLMMFSHNAYISEYIQYILLSFNQTYGECIHHCIQNALLLIPPNYNEKNYQKYIYHQMQYMLIVIAPNYDEYIHHSIP